MKRIDELGGTRGRLFIHWIVALVVVFSCPLTVAASGPATVTHPRGGELIAIGDTVEIRWANMPDGIVAIRLWNANAGRWIEIARDIPASQCKWVWIASDVVPSQICRIEVLASTGTIARSPGYFQLRTVAAQISTMAAIGSARAHEPDRASVTVVPNPATSSFRVELIDGADARLVLTDVAGRRVVASMMTGSYLLNTDGIAPGLYILTVTSNEGSRWTGTVRIR